MAAINTTMVAQPAAQRAATSELRRCVGRVRVARRLQLTALAHLGEGALRLAVLGDEVLRRWSARFTGALGRYPIAVEAGVTIGWS